MSYFFLDRVFSTRIADLLFQTELTVMLRISILILHKQNVKNIVLPV